MNQQSATTERTRIWKALAVAIAIAAMVLVTVVLPAENGYDPTRIGRALGLTKMTAQSDDPKDWIADVIGGNDNLAATQTSAMDPIPLPNPAVSQIEAAGPKTETIRVTLGFDGKTEIKAVMAKTKAILYSWKVEGGLAYVDFHGHDPSRGDNYWVRYEEADGISGRSGSLVAPFDGEHGWYWLNVGDDPITIELTVTGYYDHLVNYGLLQ